jgi:murein DD-endopeptidase MepM/ murein hydrolase activator NlpD
MPDPTSKAFDRISDAGDRFHPLFGCDVRDCGVGHVLLGGSTGDVGRYGKTRDGGTTWHRGLDFAGWMGQPVFAAHAGVVTRAGEQLSPGPAGNGFGNRVYLVHGPLTTIYAHLSGIHVQENQRLKPGYLIGWIGRSGNVTRANVPHLHFAVKVEGQYVNPEPWLAWAI